MARCSNGGGVGGGAGVLPLGWGGARGAVGAIGPGQNDQEPDRDRQLAGSATWWHRRSPQLGCSRSALGLWIDCPAFGRSFDLPHATVELSYRLGRPALSEVLRLFRTSFSIVRSRAAAGVDGSYPDNRSPGLRRLDVGA